MIPAFNEARRLRDSLACIARHLETKAYRAEIIVVDDGSTDETSSIARNVAQTISVPLRLLRYETNRVKGFALKVGFSRASGEIILFSDADLSTPIEEADRILDQLEQDGDVVIGSRKMRGSEIIVRQPWLRERLGRIFTRSFERCL